MKQKVRLIPMPVFRTKICDNNYCYHYYAIRADGPCKGSVACEYMSKDPGLSETIKEYKEGYIVEAS